MTKHLERVSGGPFFDSRRAIDPSADAAACMLGHWRYTTVSGFGEKYASDWQGFLEGHM